VDLGRDYGATVEIIRGLAPKDRLVNSPPDGLEDGSAVRIAKTVTTVPPTPASPAATPAPAASPAPAPGPAPAALPAPSGATRP